MLYDLVKTVRGKSKVVMTDYLAKINDRRKQLLSSERRGVKGQRVSYTVVPSIETEKFKSGPNTMNLSGDSFSPRRIGR